MNRGRSRDLLEASVALFVLTVVAHGLLVPWKGFYMDDWRFIQLWESSPSGSLGALMKAFNKDGFCFYRPLDIPYFTVQYWLFGRTAWAYQALLLAFDAASVLLLHAALRRATDDGPLAFVTAALFAVYPNHSATHHWLSSPFAAVAALFSAAVLLQLEAARRKTLAPALCAAILFAAAILTYEAVLPLAVLIPALCALRLRLDGLTPARARIEAALSCVSLVIFAFAALLYQQVLIPRLFPTGQSRPMQFDAERAMRVLGRSLECTTTGVAALAADSLRYARESGLWVLLPGIIFAGFAAMRLWRRWGVGDTAAGARPEWVLGGAAAWFASYAPVAISAQGYMPHVFDEQNRLNAAGAVGASMLAASGLARLSRSHPRLAAASFAAFLAVSAGIDWVTGAAYMHSWALQRRVLTAVGAGLPSGPAEVALSGVPQTVGRAAVFHADWEFTVALQVWTRRLDLTGRLVPGAPGQGRRNFVYEHREGRLEEVALPGSAAQAD